MSKRTFAKKSSRDRNICQFHASQLQVSDGAVPDDFAIGNDELNNDFWTMVTPLKSSLEYSASDFAITTSEIGGDQLITINTAQGGGIIQSFNGLQLTTPNKVQGHEIKQFSNEVEVQESLAKLFFASPIKVSR